jgi:hypothetical protein
MAKTLLNFPFKSQDACDICALSKQCRLPFSGSSISSIRPFDGMGGAGMSSSFYLPYQELFAQLFSH